MNTINDLAHNNFVLELYVHYRHCSPLQRPSVGESDFEKGKQGD